MIDIPSFQKYRIIVGIFAIFTILLGPLSAVPAAADVFEVRNVDVDVTDESATTARKKALRIGSRLAFRKLLERLTLIRDRDRLPRLESQEILSFVRNFDVANEKTSAQRYLATLSYRFKRADVRQLLSDFNLPFAETQSKPVLVLAVYQAAGTLALWDDPNPWRDGWANATRSDDLVPLIKPDGDLADVGSIGAEQAMQGDRERLQAIADRYRTSAVIVAFAQLRLDAANGRQRLEVFITRYESDPEPITEELQYYQDENETIGELLERAALASGAHIENQWKRDNLLKLNRPNVASVVVPITGLKDWLSIQDRLKGVALVRKIELILLSLDEARVNLHYVGEPDQLRVSLGQADLSLVQEDGEWVIYLADIIPSGKS